MCGHNHRPEIKKFESHFYLNTGDWIESCSAIVELMDGSIQLIKVDNNNNITKAAEL
jgi:UDP-2,3-diacylglucosamine pyrophosphatase LpxH